MAIPPTSAPVDNAAAAQAWLECLAGAARRWETPCGDGTMVWRGWGQGPAVLLLHGGAGSWRHWVRNLEALATDHTVLAPDLPGLGDSARASDPVDADAIAALVFGGLNEVLGSGTPIHIAGFSFGGVIAGLVAAMAGDRVRSLTLIGTGGLGPPGRSVELVRVRDKTGDDRLAAHRENLLRMMLASRAHVDALALEIQEQNSKRARLNSGFMWISPVLLDALPRIQGHVHALWGEHEMPDQALLAVRIGLLQKARPEADIAGYRGGRALALLRGRRSVQRDHAANPHQMTLAISCFERDLERASPPRAARSRWRPTSEALGRDDSPLPGGRRDDAVGKWLDRSVLRCSARQSQAQERVNVGFPPMVMTPQI